MDILEHAKIGCLDNDVMNVWAADFETTTNLNYEIDGEVRVYLWSLVKVDTKQEFYGFTMKDFLETLYENECKVVYFHNLKFDGKFIVYYLLANGCQYGIDFTTIIDNMNNWYAIELMTPEFRISIRDSLKKFPNTSVKQLAKLYNYPDKKDPPQFVDRYIPANFIPDKDEIEYCLHDSRIVANAIYNEHKKGHTRLTLSSDAFADVKKYLGGSKNWRKKFPQLKVEIDKVFRKGYKGGWTYLIPKYQAKEIKDVTVFDVNSLYPYVMKNCKLPIGMPKTRRYKPEDKLYIVRFNTAFTIKEGKLPTIQIKNNPLYNESEYLTNSHGDVELTLTNIDYELFKENYNIYYEINQLYWEFDYEIGLLSEYIDYHMEKKIEAEKDGDSALRMLSKLFMNSPYGKTGMNPERKSKEPYLEQDEMKFREIVQEVEGVYLPYAIFVTAHARNITIRAAQANIDNFVYADTDSIHIKTNNPRNIEVDKYILGCWKNEGFFEYAKYLKPKTYIHGDKDKNVLEIKCAGMPKECKDLLTWDDFRIGFEIDGSDPKYKGVKLPLRNKTVKGGSLLVPIKFKIKEPEIYEEQ